MAQSLSKVILHFVFSTKYRYPFIRPEIEKELFAYIGAIIKDNKGIPIIINGMPDHIHILSIFPRTISIADFMREIKSGSSKWMKSKGTFYAHFSWQRGYGVFSVSPQHIESVKSYIAHQKEHHLQKSFQKELLNSLKENDVEFDERYLWD